MQPTIQNGICTRCKEPEISGNGENALAPGTTLGKGRITVGKKLGSGGFGVTYIAYDNKLKRRVALKEFMPNYLAERQGKSIIPKKSQNETYLKAMNSFMKEARALYELRAHPNIVHVFSVFKENNTAYYTMEMLEGESFLNYLKRKKKITGNRAFQILLPIMKAIQYIHSRKMIHRDISPDNIMLCENPSRPGSVVPKLIDFGAAHVAIEGYSLSYPGVKKNGFSPLEQNWEGKAQGPWTDVYSFCATFYSALVGSVPVSAQVRSETDKDPLRPPREIGGDISPEMQDVLMRGLKLQYKERIQTMDQLIGQMTSAVENTASSTVMEVAQQIENDNPKRPVTRRVCAWLLEALLVFGGCAAFYLARDEYAVWTGTNTDAVLIALLLALAAVFLLDLILLLFAGGTIGQLIFGLRTCGEDGEGKPGIGNAMSYSLFYASFGLPVGAVLGLIWLSSGKNIGPLETLSGVTVKLKNEPVQEQRSLSGVISHNASEAVRKQVQTPEKAPDAAGGEIRQPENKPASEGKLKSPTASKNAAGQQSSTGPHAAGTVGNPPPLNNAGSRPSKFPPFGAKAAAGSSGGPSGQNPVSGQARLFCLIAAESAESLRGRSIPVRSGDKLGKNKEKSRIIIPDNTVSGLHCSFRFESGKGWFIRDENSTNGTFVNGSRLPAAGTVPLKNGTKIKTGKETFEFRC